MSICPCSLTHWASYDRGMESLKIQELARRLAGGELTVNEFMAQLGRAGTADLGEVQLDLDRRRRCGYPEVVFGQGKTVATLIKIFERLIDENVPVLATRITADAVAELSQKFPRSQYNAVARTFRIPIAAKEKERCGKVVVVTAGTSDLPVAEEARETLDWMGVEVTLVQDVGVAGPHRLPQHLAKFEEAGAVVVVAGMEGALPSVVGGYVPCPVVAVPTSVGYGASFAGVAALLSMLNSCAANVTVVNIDAGFKAGYVAGMIAQGSSRQRAAASRS